MYIVQLGFVKEIKFKKSTMPTFTLWKGLMSLELLTFSTVNINISASDLVVLTVEHQKY